MANDETKPIRQRRDGSICWLGKFKEALSVSIDHSQKMDENVGYGHKCFGEYTWRAKAKEIELLLKVGKEKQALLRAKSLLKHADKIKLLSFGEFDVERIIAEVKSFVE